jgi:hypothetical protein
MKCAAEMTSFGMIHVPSFAKIGADVQAILTFCLGNLRDCKFGVTDRWICAAHRRDELRCYDIHSKFHKEWFRHSKVDRRGMHIQRHRTHTHTHTHTQQGDHLGLLSFFP